MVQHPLAHIALRDLVNAQSPIETGLPIRIGDDCWLESGTIACPAVTNGNRIIVGTGIVVTHNITDDIVVAGNSAKVIITHK